MQIKTNSITANLDIGWKRFLVYSSCLGVKGEFKYL